ncbi:MAG: hypothetical protein ABL959_12505 [Pyrinomonadaceae bacterium]
MKSTPTARMHVSPRIDPKTVVALTEMMTLAAKQFAGYEGPITIEIIPDREPEIRKYNEEFFYAQHTF